jgi:hypothetical protein
LGQLFILSGNYVRADKRLSKQKILSAVFVARDLPEGLGVNGRVTWASKRPGVYTFEELHANALSIST